MNCQLHDLMKVAHNIQQQNFSKAGSLLNSITERAADQESASDRLTLRFVEAFKAKTEGEGFGAGNLYQGTATVSEHDMISAFRVLVEATPLIRFGYQYANQALISQLKDERRVHLIDIGITPGTQWVSFFEQLAAATPCPPSIHLTGIDVPFSDADPLQRLNEVGTRLAACARQFGIEFTYQPIASYIEKLDVSQITLLPGETLAINATLAMHHTPTADAVRDENHSRDAVLRRLRLLNPKILTLIEPDSEHNALPFVPRVQEAFRHYLAVFEALESVLPQDSKERGVLENAFFGREVLNVIAAEGPNRVERHERSDSWRRRLTQSGFRLLPFSSQAIEQESQALRLGSSFSVDNSAGMVRLQYRQTSLLAASAWCAS
jgi:hypothetical protein